MDELLDVLIVGGGPAGSATALALQRLGGLRVGLIEKSGYERMRVGETLSPGALNLLDYLGQGSMLGNGEHIRAYGNAAAWGSANLQQRDFLFTPFGAGWHLNRRQFDADLAQAAEQAGTQVWRHTRLETLQRRDEHWSLAVVQQQHGQPQVRRLRARFVVDASGKSQVVARRMKAQRQFFDCLVAVVAHYPAPAMADTFTRVEACEHGWFYSACVPDEQGQRMWWVALMTDADLVRSQGLRDPARWWLQMSACPHTRERLGGYGAPPRLELVIAHSAMLNPISGPGWLAVGDAAASYDPLSSSGIVRALDSGCQAARGIALALQGQEQAFSALGEQQQLAYQHYLATWSRYYQMEQRWPQSKFWRRRQLSIVMDPHLALVAAIPMLRASSWPQDLLPLQPDSLLAACRSPRSAADIVSQHPQRAEVGDARIILGLQWLLQAGALATESRLPAYPLPQEY